MIYGTRDAPYDPGTQAVISSLAFENAPGDDEGIMGCDLVGMDGNNTGSGSVEILEGSGMEVRQRITSNVCL